jgi:hypothetical protein
MRGVVPAIAMEVLKNERRELSSEFIVELVCLVEGSETEYGHAKQRYLFS